MPKRNDGLPAVLRVPAAAEEEQGQQRVAEAIATLLESPYCPRALTDLLEDHVIRISEQTHLYIFAPEVVRAMYPLMYRRAVEMALEREEREERERRRREKRAAKAKDDAPPTETDSVN